jgi:hypothetical protein
MPNSDVILLKRVVRTLHSIEKEIITINRKIDTGLEKSLNSK